MPPTLSLKVRHKLALICALSFVGLLGSSTVGLWRFRQALMQEKERQIRFVVDAVWGSLAHLQRRAELGELSTADAKKEALAQLKTLRYAEDNYFWINDGRPTMVMHPMKPEMNGRDLSTFRDPTGKAFFLEMVEVTRKRGAGLVAYRWPKPGHDEPVPKLSYVRAFAPWDWIIGSGIYIDDVDAQFRQEAVTLASLVLPCALLLLGFGTLVARSISARLARVEATLAEAAAGDLCARAALPPGDELGQMSERLDHMLTVFHESMVGVQAAALRTARASRDLATGSGRLSDSTQRQSASLEETTATLTEMSSAVSANATSARLADQMAAQARDDSTEGGRAVSRAGVAMSAIVNASRQVAAIANTIDEISFQTNLLALNAAVEAARVGEHGRGFAVVAASIQELAQRSAAASREVKTLVGSSTEKIEEGATLVGASGGHLTAIVSSAQKVAGLVGEIAQSASAQAERIQEITRAVTSIDKDTEQTATEAESLNATAAAMARDAQALQRLVQRFRLDGAR